MEQDLQLTKDGVLVCLHDLTLERTTEVTAGELLPAFETALFVLAAAALIAAVVSLVPSRGPLSRRPAIWRGTGG